MAIEWKQPPAQKGANGNGKWQRIVDELAERTGEWALVAENVPANYPALLKRRYLGTEWTVRGVNNSRAAELYGRVVKA